jgi:hypothetical protein
MANVGPLAISPLAGGEQMVVGLLRLRFAAGVCVLAAGLLMGAGGAVAVADPGSSGSAAHGDDGTNASGHQHSTDAKKPKDEPGDTDSMDGTRGSGGQSGQQHSTGANSPNNEPGGTDTTDEANDSGIVAAVSNEVAPVSDVAAAPVSEAAAPVSEVAVAPVSEVAAAPVSEAAAPVSEVAAAPVSEVAAAPVSEAAAPVSEVAVAPVSEVAVAPVPEKAVAPAADVVAPVPNVVGPVSDVSVLVQDMLTWVAGAVVPLTQLQSDLYSFLLGIAGVAPVSDVIALVQDMFSSVAGAVVLLAQLQSDLFSFLLGIAGVQPVVAGVGGVDGAGLSPAAGASVVSQWRLVLALTGIPGVPLASHAATGVATLDVIALGRASALPGMAPLAPDAALPIGAGSFFRHVVGELLLPVSLWALAAGALPGAGGLVILFAAGARLGFRQAKAGFALRAAGIAGFGRPGAVPLGVVRSGSLVVIRPRALRVVRPGALSAGGLLDKVA